MGTTIRPEPSRRNKYWIEKHRYYELKHFCLQYPLWKKAYESFDGFAERTYVAPIISKTNTISEPVHRSVEAREQFYIWMNLVEGAARGTDETLYSYILEGITKGIAYDYLKLKRGIPCCRSTYYELYRKFFWILHHSRK